VPIAASSEISLEELQLAARNHGLPLEALRHELTPVGLHYLLIHFDIPSVDLATWRLEVGGLVDRPATLALDELKARPTRSLAVTLECAGNGRALLEPRPLSQPWLTGAVGTAEWTGTPLAPILAEAGLQADAREVVFTGLDRGIQGDVPHPYARSLPVAEAMRDELLLAWAVNGEPLPPQHGYPLRLVVPGWYGMTHVKWLASITVIDEEFDGWQQSVAYHMRQSEEEVGAPVTRIQPRSLMVPPGVPDFFTRVRHLDAGPCRLEGRAWSGWAPIERVDVSVDGGETWEEAGAVGVRVARVGVRVERNAGRARVVLSRERRSGQRAAGRRAVELRRLVQQRGAAGSGRRLVATRVGLRPREQRPGVVDALAPPARRVRWNATRAADVDPSQAA
jgi:DMSO/TMAO reductase YedYZ molybdopterin-dependent catalytic subunit